MSINNINFSSQCKSARDLLSWKQTDLSKKSDVAISSIRRIESGANDVKDSTIEKIKKCFKEHNLNITENNKEVIIRYGKKIEKISFAKTDPIAIDVFLKGSDFIKNLSQYSSVENIHYNWSDKILEDLASAKIDIAIYNKNRAMKFISERSLDDLFIIDDICHSMGGDNFFLIGKKEIWNKISIDNFNKYLNNNKIIIITTVDSDNLDNLSLILNINHKNLKIINLDFSNIKKNIFDINQKILIYGDQNVRYDLLYNNEFEEVLNTESIEHKNIRELIKSNSNNSIIINKKIYKNISEKNLRNILKLSKNNFSDLFNNEYKKQEFIKKVKKNINIMEISDDKKDFIISNILYKTYGLSI